MIQIRNRDGTFLANITEYSFDSWKYEDINEVGISGNPEQYMAKVLYLYDNDTLVGSGIIQNYRYNKNTDSGTLIIYPLAYDLKQDFLSDNTGKYVYYNDTLENVVESIITKYRASVTSPLLSIGTKQATGITIKFTFVYQTWLEALNMIMSDFLTGENYIRIDPDGKVNILHGATTKILNYQSDTYTISYEKLSDEIINSITFDNGVPESGHILKTYEDATSIATYGKRVAYIKDSRFKYVESADLYCARLIEKHANPKIVVESIRTTDLSINLYDKIIINNWEKTFDNLMVVKKEYYKNGIMEIMVGTDLGRTEYEPKDEFDVSTETLSQANAYTDTKFSSVPTVPAYIKETYIDSTEIRSPILKGNTGYIYDILKVGPSGSIIDGTNRNIRSSNYSPNSAGWKLDNDSGNIEANNINIRNGVFSSGNINIGGNFIVDSAGNTRGNNLTNKSILFEKLGSTPGYEDGKMWCEGNPNYKVLWGYFGGDTNKQQVSTSRMQVSGSFDTTFSQTIPITTWFQPRMLIFNGFFENSATGVVGITNGQAGRVASSQGFSNNIEITRTPVAVIGGITATQFPPDWFFHYSLGTCAQAVSGCYTGLLNSISWNNTSVPKHDIFTYYNTNSFASRGFNNGAYAQVQSWSDTGLVIYVQASGGNRIAGTFTVFG